MASVRREAECAATFAMVAASLMRRQQLLMRGFEDPYAQDILPSGISTVSRLAP